MSSIRDFIPLDKLGQGTYSNVYKVKRVTDQEIYALKKVKMNSLTQKEKENALNQVRILASLESEYIVGYKQAFFDENLNVLCVVMQHASKFFIMFLDDGDLQKYIKEITKARRHIHEDQIWKAAEQIAKGLSQLHSKGILHRDIKCANIFKSSGVYKLGDLNVSKVNRGGNLAYTQTGTPYYASPQVWRDQPYDDKSDIWSFGCIIYQMAALKPPFNGKDMQDLFRNVQKGKVNHPLPRNYSSQLCSFVLQCCLQIDPRKRCSAGEIVEMLVKRRNGSNNKYNSINSDSNGNYNNRNSLLSSSQLQKPNNTTDKRAPNYATNPQSTASKRQSEQQKLLKTIQVPSDLKKLKESLPSSKYKKQQTPVTQYNSHQQHQHHHQQHQHQQHHHQKQHTNNNSNHIHTKMQKNSINNPTTPHNIYQHRNHHHQSDFKNNLVVRSIRSNKLHYHQQHQHQQQHHQQQGQQNNNNNLNPKNNNKISNDDEQVTAVITSITNPKTTIIVESTQPQTSTTIQEGIVVVAISDDDDNDINKDDDDDDDDDDGNDVVIVNNNNVNNALCTIDDDVVVATKVPSSSQLAPLPSSSYHCQQNNQKPLQQQLIKSIKSNNKNNNMNKNISSLLTNKKVEIGYENKNKNNNNNNDNSSNVCCPLLNNMNVQKNQNIAQKDNQNDGQQARRQRSKPLHNQQQRRQRQRVSQSQKPLPLSTNLQTLLNQQQQQQQSYSSQSHSRPNHHRLSDKYSQQQQPHHDQQLQQLYSSQSYKSPPARANSSVHNAANDSQLLMNRCIQSKIFNQTPTLNPTYSSDIKKLSNKKTQHSTMNALLGYSSDRLQNSDRKCPTSSSRKVQSRPMSSQLLRKQLNVNKDTNHHTNIQNYIKDLTNKFNNNHHKNTMPRTEKTLLTSSSIMAQNHNSIMKKNIIHQNCSLLVIPQSTKLQTIQQSQRHQQQSCYYNSKQQNLLEQQQRQINYLDAGDVNDRNHSNSSNNNLKILQKLLNGKKDYHHHLSDHKIVDRVSIGNRYSLKSNHPNNTNRQSYPSQQPQQQQHNYYRNVANKKLALHKAMSGDSNNNNNNNNNNSNMIANGKYQITSNNKNLSNNLGNKCNQQTTARKRQRLVKKTRILSSGNCYNNKGFGW